MKVYLAGPITGQSWEGATDWRDKSKSLLEDLGYTVASPMRGKEKLKKEIEKNGNEFHDDEYETPHPMYTQQGIFGRDTFDVKSCDILLANFQGCGNRVSIGTVFEIAYAWSLGKYVLVVMDEDNPHWSLFIRQAASVIVSDLEEAINVLDVLVE